MKITAIAFLVSFFISGLYISAKAQNVFVYAHALGGLPMDKSSKNRYSAGLGAEAGLQYALNNTLVGGSVGYTNFFQKNDTLVTGDLSYIPVRVGIRQNLAELFYIHGDAGIGFVKNKGSDNADTRFAFDVGGGVRFNALELELNVDAFKEIKPNGWSSWIGIRAGYRIGF